MKIYSITVRILMAPFKVLLSFMLIFFIGFPLMIAVCFLSAICENDKAVKLEDIVNDIFDKHIPSIFKFGCPYKE